MKDLLATSYFMADINQIKTKPLMATTRHIQQQLLMLESFSCEVDREVIERAFSSFAWPLQIQMDVGDSERSLDSQKQKFMEKLEQEKTEFEKDMRRYHEDLEWVKSLNEYSVALKVSTRIYKMKENLVNAKERVQSFVEREKLFGMDVSDYTELEVMIEGFEPFFKLWTAAIEFKHFEEEWLHGPLSRLNAGEIDQLVEVQFKESYKTIKHVTSFHLS